jgi:hypothetical protein
MPGPRLTDAARAERRNAERQRLQQAAEELLHSEGWERWVRVRATNGLARYSFHNQLLIALQRPDATYVAGFRAFLALNRCVRKGEKAIRILAPIRVRTREATGEASEATEQNPSRRTVFRAVSVFDVAQTGPLGDAEPVPLSAPSQPVTGSSHAHMLPALARFADELGYTVQTRAVEGSAEGYCDSARKLIVIDQTLAANAQVRVLIHEIAHALSIGYAEYGRDRAEVMVDTATFVVCGSLGLDTSGSSVPYVAGWGEEGALEAIRSCAQTIDAIARRIEEALGDVPAA